VHFPTDRKAGEQRICSFHFHSIIEEEEEETLETS
jgi:hypothetical protein